jgi:hypothetical protein
MNNSINLMKDIALQCGFVLNNDKIYIMRKGSKQNGLGLVVATDINGRVTVQPDKKYRDRIRATLHQALKSLNAGKLPRDDFSLESVRGMVETAKLSTCYPKFKQQIQAISDLISIVK